MANLCPIVIQHYSPPSTYVLIEAMRALTHSSSGGEKVSSLCSPPKASHSRSSSLFGGMRSLSGRMEASPSHQICQANSPHVQLVEPPSTTRAETRRSLERSWSTSSLTPSPSNKPVLREDWKQPRKGKQHADPEPVPVVHSSAYLRSKQRYAADPEIDSPTESSPSSSFSMIDSNKTGSYHRSSSSTDNALEWAMRRADMSLDELERNPHPLQKAYYSLSRGPVGEMTSSAMQAAAKLTYTTGREVTRATAPVGKWALSEGLKAAGGMLLASRSSSSKRGVDEQRKVN